MKKVCFLLTHQCSGSEPLLETLGANPRIQVYRTGRTYLHPLSLEDLTGMPHKTRNAAAVWLDEIRYNYQFGNKSLYPLARFLYMVRPAAPTLTCLVTGGYEPDFAARYYCYRLRRLAEMAKRTPGAILITPDKPALDLVAEYLSLKQPLLSFQAQPAVVASLDWELVRHCEERYEWHLFFMKQFLRFER